MTKHGLQTGLERGSLCLRCWASRLRCWVWAAGWHCTFSYHSNKRKGTYCSHLLTSPMTEGGAGIPRNAGRTAALPAQSTDLRTPSYLRALLINSQHPAASAMNRILNTRVCLSNSELTRVPESNPSAKTSRQRFILKDSHLTDGEQTQTGKVNMSTTRTRTGGEWAWVTLGQTGKIIRSVIVETDPTERFIRSSDRWGSAERYYSVFVYKILRAEDTAFQEKTGNNKQKWHYKAYNLSSHIGRADSG